MKRIIEIDEEEYKALSELSEREKVNELSYYEKIIAQSKPYEEPRDNFDLGYVKGLEDTRPKGEWIFKNGKYRCTACGEKAIYRYSGSLAITQTELLTHFCPNCGADMRKAVRNDRCRM